MAVEIAQPRLLIVEGKEDEMLFGALIRHLAIEGIQPMSLQGKNNYRSGLKALTLSPGFSEVVSLGIVRDADTDAQSAFQSVCDALVNANLPVPSAPLQLAGEKPRVAVIILPGGNQPGTLEDLCLQAFAHDTAMPCVDQYFECLQQRQENYSPPSNMSKARIQVFLASRPRAGLRLGEAAEAGYIPWQSQAFDAVRFFLHQVAS